MQLSSNGNEDSSSTVSGEGINSHIIVDDNDELTSFVAAPKNNEDDSSSDDVEVDDAEDFNKSSIKNPSLSRLELAISYKEEGNAYFQCGKLDHALRLYRRGTATLKKSVAAAAANNDNNDNDEQIKSLLVLLQTNLSMVCWKQEKYDLCKNVATQALAVDSTNIKALYRRGMACCKLGDVDEAMRDFKKALELDPTNIAIKREYASLQKHIKQTKEHKSSALTKAFSQGSLYTCSSTSTTNKQQQQPQPQDYQNDVVLKKRKLLYEQDCMERSKLDQPPIPFEEWEMNLISEKKKHQQLQHQKKIANQDNKEEQEEDSSDEELLKGLKKDQIRGYKTMIDGRTTSYFHRELSEEEKLIIGDITPKQISSSSYTSLSVGGGASVWNQAGTWEERETSEWCKEALKSRISGDASFAVASGRKKYIFDFMATLKFKIEKEDDNTIIIGSGIMKLPDISSTVVDDGNYEVDIIWETIPTTATTLNTSDSTTTTSTKSLLEAELVTSVRNSVEQFVLDFNSHYN